MSLCCRNSRSVPMVALVIIVSVFLVNILWAVPPPVKQPPSEQAPGEQAATAGSSSVPSGETYEPKLAVASNDGQIAITTFRVPEGMTVELVAAEPAMANPVAFCFDHRGRMFVAETYRQDNNRGVEDNGNHPEWADEDLASQTVADRLAYIKRHRGASIDSYTAHHDRIRLLEDTTGDGKFDRSQVFADGFNDVLDGTGAGLLMHQGRLYYTCIPRLWTLEDSSGDGRADSRQSLHYGYGVRTALRGHDLHGLCIGPDGRIYYSIGDRGFHVEHEGRTLANPESGAVLRCNPDGSELEIFATGLRNPQELAFDQYGNLFTGDNNSDSGDLARWVYVVEGGDSGWRMAYQQMRDRGPFNRQFIWHPQRADQPAYIIPPVANLGYGPSGLTYYPGTGLPGRYDGHFFLCDFAGGTASRSGVRSLAVQPKGAGFEMVDAHEFFWGILATDVDFGPDSCMYLCDWVEGWNGAGKGRAYRLVNPAVKDDPAIAETRQLLAEGMSERAINELAGLLGHKNMKVRQAAQWELAARGGAAVEVLSRVAINEDERQLARIHALWALGQLGVEPTDTLETVFARAAESDDREIKAQVARVLGWQADRQSDDFRTRAARLLVSSCLTSATDPHVQALASISLGKLAVPECCDALLDVLQRNDGRDVVLRHSASMGLAGLPLGDRALIARVEGRSAAVRMGVLLALRQRRSPEIVRFLTDDDPRLVVEATCAIHDVPITEGMPALAGLKMGTNLSADPLVRRVLNANFRAGDVEHAARIAAVAFRDDVSEAMRVEAFDMLASWSRPSSRDRVVGMWRPLPTREAAPAAAALRLFAKQLDKKPDVMVERGLDAAAQLGLVEFAPMAARMLQDAQRSKSVRLAAIRALGRLAPGNLDKSIEVALSDENAEVRATAQQIAARRNPQAMFATLRSVIETGERIERQKSLAVLGELPLAAADEVLLSLLDRLLAGQLPADMELDLLTAAGQRDDDAVRKKLAEFEAARPADDPLSSYRECFQGGDAARGELIFRQRSDVACLRCHQVEPEVESVGPNLSKIGREKDRRALLQAVIDPNREIAKDFESTVLLLDDGTIRTGIVKSEDHDNLRLMDADGKSFTVSKEQIEQRRRGQSAMPADVAKLLSKSDLRDLVEYLSQQK